MNTLTLILAMCVLSVATMIIVSLFFKGANKRKQSPLWSNGRTAEFGSAGMGSTPLGGTTKQSIMKGKIKKIMGMVLS